MIERNINLRNFNAFRINSVAEFFLKAENLPDIKQFFNEFLDAKNEVIILGGGSNVLFQSPKVKYVLNISLKGIEKIKEDDDYVWIKVGAGENWHEFLNICLENQWYGLENLSLIPGKIGAAPIQNIGAYGTEQKDFFHRAEVYSIEQDSLFEITNEQCEFAYRDSIFKKSWKGKVVILSVTYRLMKRFKPNLSYKDLSNLSNSELTPKILFDKIIEIRNSKLPNPDDVGNAGSFFKNPIITKAQFSKLIKKYPNIPFFNDSDDNYKIPAAWLIEQCNWKGNVYNQVGVSPNHSLILINLGNATGEDVYNLSDMIINSVLERFGIALEREVNIV